MEPSGGDPLRRFTATGSPPPAGTDAPLFSYLNSGKRSVTTASGELLGSADVVIIATTEQQFDPRPLLAESPQCVVVTLSDFGLTGPWAGSPATEFTLQAWSGLTGLRGY